MKCIVRSFTIIQLCNMCTSGCSGSCMTILKNIPVSSHGALVELNDLLHNIAGCGAHSSTNKNLFMTEVINLKVEARKLLEEVNHNGMRLPDGKLIPGSLGGHQNLFEDNSFKERLDNLKQRIRVLSAQTLAFK